MNILAITNIADRETAKELQERTQKRRDNGDYRPFGEILQEVVDMYKTEWTAEEILRSEG